MYHFDITSFAGRILPPLEDNLPSCLVCEEEHADDRTDDNLRPGVEESPFAALGEYVLSDMADQEIDISMNGHR
jgi:hypothetical protein